MKRKHTGKKGIVFGIFALLALGQMGSGKEITTIYAKNIEDTAILMEENQEESADATPTPTPVREVVATVTFNGNGGSFPQEGGGSAAVIEFTQEDIEQLQNYKFHRSNFPVPVRKGYILKEWRNPVSGNRIKETITVRAGKKITLDAQWTVNSYTIQYYVNGGAIASGSNAVYKYNINSEEIKLPAAERKGYHFGGWYTNGAFQGRALTSISKGSTGNVNLYAKWVSAAPAKVQFDSISTKNKQLTVKLKKASSAKGYEIVVSTSKNFSKGSTVTYAMGSSVRLSIPQPAKDEYYIKARAYAYDGTGNICYGQYSDVQKAVVKSSVKEYKATSTSAKITSAKAVTSDLVTVKATISKQIKSSDNNLIRMLTKR